MVRGDVNLRGANSTACCQCCQFHGTVRSLHGQWAKSLRSYKPCCWGPGPHRYLHHTSASRLLPQPGGGAVVIAAVKGAAMPPPLWVEFQPSQLIQLLPLWLGDSRPCRTALHRHPPRLKLFHLQPKDQEAVQRGGASAGLKVRGRTPPLPSVLPCSAASILPNPQAYDNIRPATISATSGARGGTGLAISRPACSARATNVAASRGAASRCAASLGDPSRGAASRGAACRGAAFSLGRFACAAISSEILRATDTAAD
jgi:hypothetical protein